MKQNKTGIASLLTSLILAAELAVLLDTVSVYHGMALSVVKFTALYMVLFLLSLLPVFTPRKKAAVSVGIAAAVTIPLLVGILCWRSVSQSVTYYPVDDGKAQLYGGQRVMLLVPHQDDDYNVLGGVLEEYTKYGSEVFVVYSTNGDYNDEAEERYREALDALSRMGVPADHVIFLGYGDQSNPEDPHLYNAEQGQVVSSYIGYRETYGTSAHPAYREGNAYTAENFLSDLESVVLEYLPDVIYCVDYDYHIDHRALSLGFEKAMGRILNARQDYRPLVFKGYAYNSAWEAEEDFYEENLLSTKNVFEMPDNPVPEVYRWEERTRLPVHGESLSRSVLSAKAYETLSVYASQGAKAQGARILNSDKIFWQRQTESLCYGASITASSANPELVRDFMLLESKDLKENGDFPYDSAWIPEENDSQKQIVVTFPEPQTVSSIVLYDHPDPEHNVQNARIAFDDGTTLETGPLDAAGAASVFPVEKTEVSSFTVTLLETQGKAGLSEIEAFGPDVGKLPGYGKLMDAAGNFVYDYWIDAKGVQDFFLYTHRVDFAGVTFTSDSDDCTVVRLEDRIQVTCPTGQSCVISAIDEDGTVLDRVFLRNPSTLERGWKMFWLRAEEKIMDVIHTKLFYERIFVCRLYAKCANLLNRFF